MTYILKKLHDDVVATLRREIIALETEIASLSDRLAKAYQKLKLLEKEDD